MKSTDKKLVDEAARSNRTDAKPGATADVGPSENQAAQRLEELARLAAQSTATLDDLTEAVIAWSQAAFGTAEIVAAQEQFFAEMGKAFPDDPFFDARMSYFFDWFLLERPVSVGDATPYALVRQQMAAKGLALAPSAAQTLDGLGRFRHSLFEITKIQETSMVVSDLITPGKVAVSARDQETFRGLEKKAIFQGFVYQVGEQGLLSHGLVLHPAKILPLLKKRLKTAKKSPDFAVRAELCRFASLQLRYLRHRHVEPKTIYQAGLK